MVTNFQRKKQIWPNYLIASLGGDFPQACTFLLSAIQTQPKNQTFYNDKSELWRQCFDIFPQSATFDLHYNSSLISIIIRASFYNICTDQELFVRSFVCQNFFLIIANYFLIIKIKIFNFQLKRIWPQTEIIFFKSLNY